MDEKIALEPAEDGVVKYKAAIDELLAELDRRDERMRADQEEIDRLKAETRASLARLEAAA